MTATGTPEWIEVCVKGIARPAEREEDPAERSFVMILAERDGDRILPIWIGPPEATVLALALESVETPRPFPYKLAAGLVEAAGSRISEVRITALTDGIFYASVIIPGPDGAPTEVDARPSDGVNLAVVCGVPIVANSQLFEAATDCGPDGERLVRAARMATAEIVAETQERFAARRRRYRSTKTAEGGEPADQDSAG